MAARRVVLTLAADVATGADIQARKRDARLEGKRKRNNRLETFLSDQYGRWAATHLKTATFQISRIKADFAGWMNKPLAELNAWLIENWRTAQAEQGKQPKTINRDLQQLQALLAKAVDWGVLEEHPFRGLKPLKIDRTGRVRYLPRGRGVLPPRGVVAARRNPSRGAYPLQRMAHCSRQAGPAASTRTLRRSCAADCAAGIEHGTTTQRAVPTQVARHRF